MPLHIIRVDMIYEREGKRWGYLDIFEKGILIIKVHTYHNNDFSMDSLLRYIFKDITELFVYTNLLMK